MGGDSRRLRGILRHGAVSCPALQRWNHFGSATRRLRQPNFNHSRDGTAATVERALQMMEPDEFDAALLNYRLDHETSLEIARALNEMPLPSR